MIDWIECSKQLPPKGEPVIVHWVGHHSNYTVTVGCYSGENHNGIFRRWWDFASADDEFEPVEGHSVVSHWMPLPEPPEQEGQE